MSFFESSGFRPLPFSSQDPPASVLSAHTGLLDSQLTTTGSDKMDLRLIIRQQPEQAKVYGGKEKDRKAIDPPPFIELRMGDVHDPVKNYLQSPWFFMCATLFHGNEDVPVRKGQTNPLGGTLVSSLHRLKDVDDKRTSFEFPGHTPVERLRLKYELDAGFFVFGDLSVKIEGQFRLKFSLYELQSPPESGTNGGWAAKYLDSIMSNVFQVFSAKQFPGAMDATFLTRSFSDQGVKLRVRKDARMMKRSYPIQREFPPDRPLMREFGDRHRPGSSGSPDGNDTAHIERRGAYNNLTALSLYNEGRPTKRSRTSSDLSSLNYFSDHTQYSSPRYNGYNTTAGVSGYGSHLPAQYNANITGFGNSSQPQTAYERSNLPYTPQDQRQSMSYASTTQSRNTLFSSQPDSHSLNGSYARDSLMPSTTTPRQQSQSYNTSDRPMLPPPERYLSSTSSPTQEYQRPPDSTSTHSRNSSDNAKAPTSISHLVSSQSNSLPPITTIAGPAPTPSYASYRNVTQPLSANVGPTATSQQLSQPSIYGGFGLQTGHADEPLQTYDQRQASSYSQIPLNQQSWR